MAPDQRQIKLVDNPDDRREIRTLLRKLSPCRRITFAKWCCQQASLGNTGVKPQVSPATQRLAQQARWDSGADERLSVEIYFDLWFLCCSYNFNLDRALAKLVEMVRKP